MQNNKGLFSELNIAKNILYFISALIFLLATSSFADEIYTVKKGDSLYKISKQFKIKIKSIKDANSLTSNRLRPGITLKIPSGKSTSQPLSMPKTYTVKKGDTLYKIVRKSGISVQELKDLNGLKSNKLMPGQKLLLEAFPHAGGQNNAPQMSEAEFSEEIKTISESVDMDLKEHVLLISKKMLNIPYRFGGSTFRGMDCSAYVQYVFSLIDIFLPRSAREQFNLGQSINKEDLSIGDLVFFRTYARFPSHVGIYLGDNMFIHASSKERKVTIDNLDKPYYLKRFIGAKRLLFDEADNEELPQTKN